jgi:hypothetical protein
MVKFTYIECPNTYRPQNETKNVIKIFLAGGITNCPDWQQDAVHYLKDYSVYYKNLELVVFNPRRSDVKMIVYNERRPETKDFLKDQIEWEHKHLSDADIVMFWFPKESVCPISLYELGSLSSRPEDTAKLVIGTEKQYSRREDIIIQTELRCPGIDVTDYIPNTVRYALAKVDKLLKKKPKPDEGYRWSIMRFIGFICTTPMIF